MRADAKILLCKNTLQSFFTTWALMKAFRMEPGNVLTGTIFLLSFFLYRRIYQRMESRPYLATRTSRATCFILSVLFTFFYMIVDYRYSIESLSNPLFRAIVLSSVCLGFVTLFYQLLRLLFSYSGDIPVLRPLLFTANEPLRLWEKHVGLVSFLLCFLCWLPYYLYHFPGIMTPDSVVQFEQVIGMIPYSNHHPVVHTLLIKLFYSIGLFFTGNQTVAMSFYTMFQMCFLATTVSYFIRTLRIYDVKPILCIFITLFYALVPYHAVFSVTVWKDILFAGAVLLFSCSLLRLMQKTKASSLTVFVLSGIMLCLFRSNGWYGFCLCLPFLLFYFRGKKKVMYPAILSVLLTATIIKYPVMNSAGVIQPDLIESLSVPTQQIAAVICNDRPLTREQFALIEEVVDLTYIKDLYNPTFADNMKELVRAGNQDYLASHKGEFFRLWLDLGLTYPWDYVEAYVKQTYGYFYPDSFYLVAEAEGISASHLGVAHTPLIGGPIVVKTKEIALKLGSMLPIYSLLWSMGVIFWAFLFCIGNAFVRKEKAKLIVYLPSLALYLTVMIATPVATEFRYVYFMIFSLPFYLMTALIPLPDLPSDACS